MKIMKLVPAIAGILFAQSVSVRGPELTMSGSTISHARTDGNIHVPRSFGVPDGYQLTTHGGSGDAYWAAPGGAFVDSARAAKKADTANYATVAGHADSARVSGLSDSTKALVRYARTTAVHDTADSVRKYTRDRIKDSLTALRAASTLQAAYGASTAPQITTNTAKGSLTIRRGTASDTNAVIAVQNGAGTVTSRLNGDGSFAGTRSILTTTLDAPVTISHNLAGAFTHPFQAFNSGMVAGNQYNFDFGQSASTNNAGNFGFKYLGAGSSSNYVTLGLYGANDLLTITAAGVPKFSGLTASKFVKTDASKNLVSTDVAYSDLTGAVPTWNQSTTGNAATATKWATARTLTIGATGKAVDGSANVSWSLAEIGAAPAHAVGANIVLKSNGSGGLSSSQITDDGATVATPAGKLRSYDATYAGIWGSSVASPTNLNYGILIAKDGSASGLNGTTSAALAAGGVAKVTASVSAITLAATTNVSAGAIQIGGTDVITSGRVATFSNLTSGLAKLGTWAYGSTYARFGHSSWDLSAGMGYLQNSNGALLMESPTGAGIYFRNAGTEKLRVDGTGVRVNTVAAGSILKLDASRYVAAAIASDFPILNQNTTGSAATLTTPRTFTIGSTGKTFDGSANVSWSLAEIGAQAAGSYQPLENQRLSTTNSPTFAAAAIGGVQLAGYGASYAGLWGGSVATRTNLNYALLTDLLGTSAGINGTASSVLAVNGGAIVTATTSGATLAGTTTLSALTGATTRIATISATGQIGAATTFPMTGVVDGSSASSGIVGEIISASASGTSFTGTSAGVSLVSISLPAGSWLVWGSADITNGASPLGLSVYLSYSPTGTSYINANTSFALGSPVANSGITCHNAPTPINSSSTATVYLIGSEVTTGAVAVNTGATIYAQRIR
jgi:hypothetical protein